MKINEFTPDRFNPERKHSGDNLSRHDANDIMLQKFKTWEKFKEFFTANYSFKKIGAGDFSIVYLAKRRSVANAFRGFPRELVLKVSKTNKAEKDQWNKFVPIAQRKFASNKLFPMIFGHMSLPQQSGVPVDVSIIEYLTVDPGSERSRAIQRAAGEVVSYYDEYGVHGPDPDQDEDEFVDFESAVDDLGELGIDQKSFEDLYMTLYTNKGFEYDIHAGNIGYRADGSICIFDPIV